MCKQLEIYYTGIYVHPYSTALTTMKQDVPYVKLYNLEATEAKQMAVLLHFHESLMTTHSRLLM